MNKLQTLYKIDSGGSVRQWIITIDGNTYYSTKGLVTGKQTADKPTLAVGKNAGKANATTDVEQALLEAQARWEKKIKAGYATTPQGAINKPFFDPMLAKNYKDRKKHITYPVYSQPKLDGIRCIVRLENGEIVARSRTGRIFESIPHIIDALDKFFAIDETVVFDGELYNHTLKNNFNKIVSLVRKKRPVKKSGQTDVAFKKKEKEFQERLDESAKLVEYHIYDVPYIDGLNTDELFSLRNAILDGWSFELVSPLEYVPTYKIITEAALDSTYADLLYAGYEGQIIRIDGGYAEGKRSNLLLKRKEFQDAEYKVIDMEEGLGNRAGTAKNVTCYCPTTDSTFKSNIKGSREYLTDLLKKKDTFIGAIATIKFFELTPDGIPRFPFVIAFRDYE